MKIVGTTALPLSGVHLVRFGRFPDSRGYFTETFRRSDFDRLDFLREQRFLQCNESFSRAGVLRGLHLQWNPYMGKLVRTVTGRMIDLVLDVRLGSPTWGKAIAVEMSSDPEAAEAEWIWVPPGFAHGTLSIEPTLMEYFCTGEYSPQCEAAIFPLGEEIDWSLGAPAARQKLTRLGPAAEISAKDRAGLTLTQWRENPSSRQFRYRAV